MAPAPATRSSRRRRLVRRRRFVAIVLTVIIAAALVVGVAGFVRSLSERPQPTPSVTAARSVTAPATLDAAGVIADR